jgi:mRNA interferase RelE/StbE
VSSPLFSIQWAATAKRDLQRLPEKLGRAVVEFVYGSLADNPQRVGRALHLELAGHHAARRGEYRVVYRIDQESRSVIIVHIDNRADVYRKR